MGSHRNTLRLTRMTARFFSVVSGLCLLLAIPQTAIAKESLGIFGQWGAFRDRTVPRCYAIAMALPDKAERTFLPFASVGTWPKRAIRGQFHARLSRKVALNSPITLRIGGASFTLVGGGGDAWARDKAMDAEIVAAMRSAGQMHIGARDEKGRRFSNTYELGGAATAMDAATVGCAKLR